MLHYDLVIVQLCLIGTFKTVTEVQSSNMRQTEINKHKSSEKGNYLIIFI